MPKERRKYWQMKRDQRTGNPHNYPWFAIDAGRETVKAKFKRTERQIITAVRDTGCLPRYAHWRTVQSLKERKVIYFDGKRYRLCRT